MELTWATPIESVIQTYPPALVPEDKVIVPAKTPLASIVPVPLYATPPAPVVGAVTAVLFCGFKRILQSSQLAVNPPPVTAISAPRTPPVVGENLVNDVIAVWVAAATAVASLVVFTVTVPVPVASAD